MMGENPSPENQESIRGSDIHNQDRKGKRDDKYSIMCLCGWS